MHAHQHLTLLVMLDAYPDQTAGDRLPHSTRGPSAYRRVRSLRGRRRTVLIS
jgi:hypothetical protein